MDFPVIFPDGTTKIINNGTDEPSVAYMKDGHLVITPEPW